MDCTFYIPGGHEHNCCEPTRKKIYQQVCAIGEPCDKFEHREEDKNSQKFSDM